MALLLGIDFGTSYFKVGLFEPTGALRGLGRVAVGKDSFAPGRSEVPVERFWHLLRTGLTEALVQAGADAGLFAGVPEALLAMVHSDRVVPPQAPAVAVYARARAAAT